MKVKIKTLEELVKGHPSAYVPIRVGLLAGQEVDTAEYIALEPWMYTEIKPEEVKLYAYEIHNNGVAFFLFDTGAADRRPEYDLVFKGEER